jgi:putative resolvase
MDQVRNSPLGLSTSQAASALGVSLGTIRRWADMGYLESYRTPGGQRRFSVDQIEQFLETLQQRRSGQQQHPQHQQQERLVG